MTPPHTSPAAPVDTSVEAVAELVRDLRAHAAARIYTGAYYTHIAATLAAVVKEREDWARRWDAAAEEAKQWKASNSALVAELRSTKERMWESGKAADTASRQLAEARAAHAAEVAQIRKAVIDEAAKTDASIEALKEEIIRVFPQARALLSGETNE